MIRSLDAVSTELRPLIDALLARLAADGVPVRVISTLRTLEEHQANLRAGTSSARLSYHLPRRLRVPMAPDAPNANASDAVDLVLVDAKGRAIWSTADARWAEIGAHAEALGLEWGGRWRKPYDPGHVQLPRTQWAT
jgi:hypothetical protein